MKKFCQLMYNTLSRRDIEDMTRKLVKTAVPWLVPVLVLALIMTVLFTAKPVEAG